MSDLNALINSEKNHLIDVRTTAEVAEVSVKGAANIPLDTIPQRLEEFKEMSKTGELVLFCRSGARSENAKGFLLQNGITNVHNAGGYADVQIHKL